MTEQDAIERLEIYKNFDFSKGSKEAMQVAIKALEEQIKIKSFGDCYIIPRNGLWEVNGVDVHKAIEKQIAKKPIDKIMFSECPNCHDIHIEGWNYCGVCGQKLDWSDEDDNS